MGRKRQTQAVEPSEQPGAAVDTVIQQAQERQPGEDAPEPSKKKWTPSPDPFGTEGIKAGDNRVHLLKSTQDRAWLIRFDKNPNEGRAKDDPHPVLAYIKSEGYRWNRSDADGNLAWGKPWDEGHYSYAEHMQAREVVRKAAEMLGPVQEQGIPI